MHLLTGMGLILVCSVVIDWWWTACSILGLMNLWLSVLGANLFLMRCLVVTRWCRLLRISVCFSLNWDVMVLVVNGVRAWVQCISRLLNGLVIGLVNVVGMFGGRVALRVL